MNSITKFPRKLSGRAGAHPVQQCLMLAKSSGVVQLLIHSQTMQHPEILKHRVNRLDHIVINDDCSRFVLPNALDGDGMELLLCAEYVWKVCQLHV